MNLVLMLLQSAKPKSFSLKIYFLIPFQLWCKNRKLFNTIIDVHSLDKNVQQCWKMWKLNWSTWHKHRTKNKIRFPNRNSATNLQDGKQLPAIIDVVWALVVKQEPVDGQKITHLTPCEILKWRTSYISDKSYAIKKLCMKYMTALENSVHRRVTIRVTMRHFYHWNNLITEYMYLLQHWEEVNKWQFAIKGEQSCKNIIYEQIFQDTWKALKKISRLFQLDITKLQKCNSFQHSICSFGTFK